MCLEDTARIPLRARDGSIRAYAIVDAKDADWVNQWRWQLNPKTGYAQRSPTINGKIRTVTLHRELMRCVPFDGVEIDHINRDRLDNRRSNLRRVTKSVQQQNVTSGRGTSSHRGVSWEKRTQKWMASVSVRGKTIFLGRFSGEDEAAEAARAGRARLMPYATD